MSPPPSSPSGHKRYDSRWKSGKPLPQIMDFQITIPSVRSSLTAIRHYDYEPPSPFGWRTLVVRIYS